MIDAVGGEGGEGLFPQSRIARRVSASKKEALRPVPRVSR